MTNYLKLHVCYTHLKADTVQIPSMKTISKSDQSIEQKVVVYADCLRRDVLCSVFCFGLFCWLISVKDYSWAPVEGVLIGCTVFPWIVFVGLLLPVQAERWFQVTQIGRLTGALKLLTKNTTQFYWLSGFQYSLVDWN